MITTNNPNSNSIDLQTEEQRGMEVEETRRQRRRKVVLYDKHQFSKDLGFTSSKEMFATMMAGGDVESDVPLHLTIQDVGDTKFSKHPSRMLQVALKSFLDIQEIQMMPSVSIWTSDSSVEVNVEVKSERHAEKLLRSDEIFGIQVRVQPHKFRNFSRATVWDGEGTFAAFSDEELATMLKHKAVVEVKREEYRDRSTGETLKGKKYRITFNKKVPPKFLKFPALGIQMETKLFIPKPFVCWHCAKIGHNEGKCPKKEQGKVCYRCSETHGEGADKCTAEAKCVNCRGQHPASFKGCPAYKQEEEVKRLAVEGRISPRDVIRKLKSEGQYVDYTRTTAQRVQAPNVGVDRMDAMEKSIIELKGLIIGLAQARHAPSDDSERADESQQVENVNDQLRQENERLKNELEHTSAMRIEVQELREEIQRIKEQKTETTPSDELKQLRNDINFLRDQHSKSVKIKEEDERVKNKLLTKVQDLKDQMEEKDKEIKSMKSSGKRTSGSGKPTEKDDRRIGELLQEIELLKTENQLRTEEARKHLMAIEKRDALIKSLQPADQRDRSRSTIDHNRGRSGNPSQVRSIKNN